MIHWVHAEDDKSTLINLADTHAELKAGDSLEFDFPAQNIVSLVHEGNDLSIMLNNGRAVTANNFFADNTTSLAFQDTRFTPENIATQLTITIQTQGLDGKTTTLQASPGSTLNAHGNTQYQLQNLYLDNTLIARQDDDLLLVKSGEGGQAQTLLIFHDFYADFGQDHYPSILIPQAPMTSANVTVINPASEVFSFQGSPVTTASIGVPYAYFFHINLASDKDLKVTYNGESIPAWLTLTALGNGNYLLHGIPKKEHSGQAVIAISSQQSIKDQQVLGMQSFELTVGANIIAFGQGKIDYKGPLDLKFFPGLDLVTPEFLVQENTASMFAIIATLIIALQPQLFNTYADLFNKLLFPPAEAGEESHVNPGYADFSIDQTNLAHMGEEYQTSEIPSSFVSSNQSHLFSPETDLTAYSFSPLATNTEKALSPPEQHVSLEELLNTIITTPTITSASITTATNILPTVVTIPPTPPVAHDDSISAAGNVPFIFNANTLLANDTDANGDHLSVTTLPPIVTANGVTISIPDSEIGDWVYKAPKGTFGPDSFQYTISDPSGATSTATVHITVAKGAVFSEDADVHNFNTDNPNNYDLSTYSDVNDSGGGDDIVYLPLDYSTLFSWHMYIDEGGLPFNAGPGNDTIHADNGTVFNYIIFGGEGNDTIYGGLNFNSLHGNEGDDIIYGGQRSDEIYGDEGNDTLHGGDGNDYIDGGPGQNKVYGEGNDDTLVFHSEDVFTSDGLISGGPGTDTLAMQTAGEVVDFRPSSHPSFNISEMEIISLDNDNIAITLDKAGVSAITSGTNALEINTRFSTGGHVTLDATDFSSVPTPGPPGYNTYTSLDTTTTVAIADHDITVNVVH